MIEIRKSTDGEYYFVILTKNKRVLATSETYTRKENAIKGAELISGVKLSIIDGTK